LKYSITGLECLSFYSAFKENDVLLANSEVTVYTDHSSLVNLMKTKLSANSRLMRWTIFLQPFKIKIVHRSGASNVIADCLSTIDWQAVKREEAAMPQAQPDNATIATMTPPSEKSYYEFDIADDSPFVCSLLADAKVVQQIQLPDTADFRAALPTRADFGPMYNYLLAGDVADKRKARATS
jgi:hypothetical protein